MKQMSISYCYGYKHKYTGYQLIFESIYPYRVKFLIHLDIFTQFDHNKMCEFY